MYMQEQALDSVRLYGAFRLCGVTRVNANVIDLLHFVRQEYEYPVILVKATAQGYRESLYIMEERVADKYGFGRISEEIDNTPSPALLAAIEAIKKDKRSVA